MKIDLYGPIPIPVGHRVSVRWFHRKSKGLFGGEDDESRADQPLIEDLDTGIVHAFDWLYDIERHSPQTEPLHFSGSLSKGLDEQRAVVGRLTSCRIFTVIDPGRARSFLTQTELDIAPEGEPGAYR